MAPVLKLLEFIELSGLWPFRKPIRISFSSDEVLAPPCINTLALSGAEPAAKIGVSRITPKRGDDDNHSKSHASLLLLMDLG